MEALSHKSVAKEQVSSSWAPEVLDLTLGGSKEQHCSLRFSEVS